MEGLLQDLRLMFEQKWHQIPVSVETMSRAESELAQLYALQCGHRCFYPRKLYNDICATLQQLFVLHRDGTTTRRLLAMRLLPPTIRLHMLIVYRALITLPKDVRWIIMERAFGGDSNANARKACIECGSYILRRCSHMVKSALGTGWDCENDKRPELRMKWGLELLNSLLEV